MRKSILAALAVLSLVAIGCGEGSSTGEEDVPVPVSERVDPLAQRYAPVVWIHPKERFGPTAVDRFLTRSELTWRTAPRLSRDPDLAARGALAPARLGSGCAEQGGGCYLHAGFAASELTRPHHEDPSRPPGLGTGDGFYLDPDDSVRRGETQDPVRAPVYYEIRKGAATRIDFWLFFGYSRPNETIAGVNVAAPFSHEGDWENIEVVLGARGRPRAVRYFGHGHPRSFPWAEICKEVEGGEEACGTAEMGRPVVYSALFSHASYATPAQERSQETKVCAKGRLGFLCSHDFRGKGLRWDPLAPGGALRDARLQPWYGFGGAWGSAGLTADTTGPLGPSPYKLPGEAEPGELESVAPEQPPAP